MLDLNALDFNITNESYDDLIQLSEGSIKDIAIIGISARIGQDRDVNEFWENIKNKKDYVTKFPDSRKKDIDEYFSLNNNKEMEYDLGTYFSEIDKFDYKFFTLSPNEANLMDPNQRLFLENAYHVLEDAGYGGRNLSGTKTGVFIGFTNDTFYDYKRILLDIDPSKYVMAMSGNVSSIIASRISYMLDLKGPSMLIDTACSSSLVAVHLACQSIRNGESELAIAGGININLAPIKMEEKIGIESSDSRTRTFDDSSDGTVLGEGVAAILLKPLREAIKDKDNIYAVIKGSAINQDGNSIGITAPNSYAQEEVISSAWEDADVNPENISYIEAHGTGTNLGDPMEVEGIDRAFRRYTNKKQFCTVGAVKTNIGHLDNNSGMAGLIKLTLALKNKEIPGNIHFNRPNRKIDFINSPIYINDKLKKWESTTIRRGGVSSFGLSGTNCHVILEEAPNVEDEDIYNIDEPQILTISAKSKETLKEYIKKYKSFFNSKEDINFAEVCYTANTGKGHYKFRIAIIAKDKNECLEKLKLIDLNYIKNSKNGHVYCYDDLEEFESDDNEEIKYKLSKLANEKIEEYVLKDDRSLLGIICDMYIKGANIEWKKIYKNRLLKKISIPTYPFERTRCWININKANGDSIKGDDSICVNLVGRQDNLYSELERTIGQIWSNILGMKTINIKDNLYNLGGDSILATQIANNIRKQVKKQVLVSDVLRYLTIEEFCEFLEHRKNVEENIDVLYLPIETINNLEGYEKGCYPMSSAQKRLFVLDQFNEIGTSYNMPEVVLLKGHLDINRFENAFRDLINRHEVLRTTFELMDGKFVQHIHEKVQYNLDYIEAKEGDLDSLIKDFIRPFNLGIAPLLRTQIIRLESDKHILLYDMHHIISDGTSIGVLAKDLFDLYKGIKLSELKIQYKDFTIWQNELRSSDIVKKQENYWINRLSGDLLELDMPTDYERPRTKSFVGDVVNINLNKVLSEKLNKLAQEENITLYMVLNSIFNVLLAKYSKQSDIIIGTAISGRQHMDLDPLIGMFVNTLVLRAQPKSYKKFSEFLVEVKKIVLEAYENQDYQFEELIDKLHLERDPSRNPLVDVLFVLQNTVMPEIKVDNLQVSHIDRVEKVSRFDLYLSAIEEDVIRLDLEYSVDLFKRETIEKMLEDYVRIAEIIADNKEIKIQDIKLINDKNENNIDIEFNF